MEIYDAGTREEVVEMARIEDGLKVPYVRALISAHEEAEAFRTALHRIAFSNGGKFELVNTLREIAREALEPASVAKERSQPAAERKPA